MIIIIDTCFEENSIFKLEFVKPIEDLTSSLQKQFTTIHFSNLDKINIQDFEKIIICGNGLQDFAYLDHISKFQFLTQAKIPIFGICAGMQILAILEGANTIDSKEIGIQNIQILIDDIVIKNLTTKDVFSLHKKSVTIPETFIKIATTNQSAQIIKHKEKPIYGVMFHPEVMNKEIIKNFLKLN